jgi:hypothetical protein
MTLKINTVKPTEWTTRICHCPNGPISRWFTYKSFNFFIIFIRKLNVYKSNKLINDNKKQVGHKKSGFHFCGSFKYLSLRNPPSSVSNCKQLWMGV